MRNRGFTILFAMLALTVLVGFVSLAVDYGHIQAARFQLNVACDAAARAGVQSLGSTTLTPAVQALAATNAAVAIASQNAVDNQPVLLDSTMVQIGNYSATASPTFLVGRLPYNAVEVNAYRDQAHNDPIQLAFASSIGITTFDINATSIAERPSQPSQYGIVGLQSASFASLGVVSSIQGNIVSNGNISVGMPLGVGVSVSQSAMSYSGSVSVGPLASVSGNTQSLSSQLSYPSVTVPKANDNATIQSNLDASSNFTALGVTDIYAGTYVVHDLNLLGNVVVNLHGPVTFYVTGAFNMAATVNLLNLLNTDPNNFNIMVVPGGTVNIIGSLISPTCMNIYAPDTAITIAVCVNHYTGSIVGKTLDICAPVLSTFTECAPPSYLMQTALVQ